MSERKQVYDQVTDMQQRLKQGLIHMVFVR